MRPPRAGRVHDQVGGEDLLGAARGPHPRPRDPVAGWCGDQAGYLTPVPDRDVVQRPDPAADMGFQVRPALRIRWLAGFAVPAQQVAAEIEPELLRSAQYRDATGHQFGEQPGEQLVEDLRPPRQQGVSVPALGNSLAVQPGVWQQVTFDDRHLLVCIGQDPGRQQPAHAGAEHHRVVTDLGHLLPPVFRRGTRASLLAPVNPVAASSEPGTPAADIPLSRALGSLMRPMVPAHRCLPIDSRLRCSSSR